MPHGDLQNVEAPNGDRLVILTGIVTLTTSGTVSTATVPDCNGFTVAKTSTKTGRYTITLNNKFLKLMYGHAVLEISADTAAVSAKGVAAVIRNAAPTTGTLDLQFTIVPTAIAAGADAEAEDSAVVHILLVMSRGKI